MSRTATVVVGVICVGMLSWSGFCFYRGVVAIVAGVDRGGWSGAGEVFLAVVAIILWGITAPALVLGAVFEEASYCSSGPSRAVAAPVATASVAVDDRDGDGCRHDDGDGDVAD